MGTLFISLLTLVLLLVSAFIILIVLMQRTSQSGGMGAALGGGAAESAFGSETNNILTKGTIYGIIVFFLVALGLYLIYQNQATLGAQRVDPASLIGPLAVDEVPFSSEADSTGLTEGSAEESSVLLPPDEVAPSTPASSGQSEVSGEENIIRVESE